MIKDNQQDNYQESKDTLDNLREKFNNSMSILSEESIRDIIRKEVIQQGQNNQQYDRFSQFRQQDQYGLDKQNQDNKKVKFNENEIKQANRTRLNRDLQDLGIYEQRNEELNQLFNLIALKRIDLYKNQGYQQAQDLNEDLRNTVLFEEIPNQKTAIKQQQQYNNSIWEEILLFYDKNDLNSCYQIVLDAGINSINQIFKIEYFLLINKKEDDVYLIKLMMLTGPCMKYLDINTSKRLMSRICMILDSKFLEKMYLSVFQHSLQERILDNLTVIEQKKLTNEVYKLSSSSNPQIGEESAELYIRLAQKFTSNI